MAFVLAIQPDQGQNSIFRLVIEHGPRGDHFGEVGGHGFGLALSWR